MVRMEEMYGICNCEENKNQNSYILKENERQSMTHKNCSVILVIPPNLLWSAFSITSSK